MHDLPSVTVQDLPDPLPEGIHVLDVREAREWEHGHIEGAVHIPLAQITDRLDELPQGHTVVVCTMGGRSAQVVAYLAKQGHDVVNLQGGLIEWADAGRTLVSDHDHPAHVV